jgi:hypothetical protein
LCAQPDRSIELNLNALDRQAQHRKVIGGLPAHADRAKQDLRPARDWPQQLHGGALKPRIDAMPMAFLFLLRWHYLSAFAAPSP